MTLSVCWPPQAAKNENVVQQKAYVVWHLAYERHAAKSLTTRVPYTWNHMLRAGLSASTAIMTMCNYKHGTIVYRNGYGPQVIRLSSGVAVKFGHGVTRPEALNQHFAFRHASPDHLRVPRVFSFLVDTTSPSYDRVGYIVMEYIEGHTLHHLSPERKVIIARKVAAAMQHLTTFPVPVERRPGPIMTGGMASGYFWSDYGSPVPFETLESMIAWINGQLAITHPRTSIPFSTTELAFRHMDVNLRNTLVTTDDRICFVDWEFSGFYPSLLELIHLKFSEWECRSFSANLLANLPEMSQGLQDPRYPLLLQVISNNMRFGTDIGNIEPP